MIKELVLVGALVAVAALPLRPVARADDVAPVSTATLDRLKEIARDYEKAGKVDDLRRFAPSLCSDPGPPRPRVSTEHEGRKLYFLYAKDRDAYVKNEMASGQWVVKESFRTDRDGHAGERAGLFIMLRLDFCGSAPDYSDCGWVYATATPEGEIKQAGKIASCAACHGLAEHERLFGIDNKRRERP
jgi:hypothetical protein